MKIAAPLNPAQAALQREAAERTELWRETIAQIEGYLGDVDHLPVSSKIDLEAIHRLLAEVDFDRPMAATDAVRLAAEGFRNHQVQTPHPRYFGLFNPGSTTMGIAADALVAAFNPQLASWTHNPFGNELERRLILELGMKFGYREPELDGTFCTGGAEANHTALITALVAKFPAFAQEGLRALDAQPTLYVSQQAHHSFVKAARFCGLGAAAVREVPVTANAAMDPAALAELIQQDLWDGKRPFFVVGTLGTTNAGVLDPIPAIRDVARQFNLWFHTDAAWGGMAALLPEFKHLLEGVGDADSITFDAHKMLSVPMAAGIFFTKHPTALGQACRITTDYMPPIDEAITDPYTHSLQWSRRCIGLKVFLSLAVAGWEGYAQALRHQTAMGDELRSLLAQRGWQVVNDTPLPTICFIDPERELDYADVMRRIVEDGRVWISTTRLAKGRPVLRACITSFRTNREDLVALLDVLEEVRANGARNEASV